MSRRTVSTARYTYVIAPEDDLSISMQSWALVKAQLIDELNGRAPSGRLRLACDNAHFLAQVSEGGFAGLAGVPASVIPLHRTNPYTVTMTVTSDGYVTDERVVTIPADGGFPGSFTPFDSGPWLLHRNPTSIYGRVELLTPAGTSPVPNTTVRLTKMWLMVPTPVGPPGPDPFEPLTLAQPLYAARPVGATVRTVAMPISGGPYQLVKEAEPGDTAVLVSHTVGLATGLPLALDLTDPDRAEYIEVIGTTGATLPTQPATVLLNLPLRARHRGLIDVFQTTPGVPGALNTTGVEAISGDRVLLLDVPVGGIATGDVVQISGGPAPLEYQTASRFSVKSDANGHYRLPLLSRTAQLEITADDGVHAAVAQLAIPEYGQEENRVDFLLR